MYILTKISSSCKSLSGYSNLNSQANQGAMYGGFYVLYDEAQENLDKEAGGKGDDDDARYFS